eukprot:16448979-Heterocapsa_arctica.AAC.1
MLHQKRMGSPGCASEILVCASPPAPGATVSGADAFERFSIHLNGLRRMPTWPVYFLAQCGPMSGASVARVDYVLGVKAVVVDSSHSQP